MGPVWSSRQILIAVVFPATLGPWQINYRGHSDILQALDNMKNPYMIMGMKPPQK